MNQVIRISKDSIISLKHFTPVAEKKTRNLSSFLLSQEIKYVQKSGNHSFGLAYV